MTLPSRLCLTTLGLLLSLAAIAQTDSAELEEVRVQAYGHDRRLRDVPASVSYIGNALLQRFSPVSMFQAVNTAPGVRMEERSPGSYRFNIRGSSLRAPFGVRNVKVYYNDIPITDPGGHTFLNQLGTYNLHHLEVIKGPGSSLYGAGTGGALLIESMGSEQKPGLLAEYSGGSFGLQNIYGRLTTGDAAMQHQVGFQLQQSDGYRDHSALRREVLSWNGHLRIGSESTLKTTFLYGDLFYETPGGLTAAEYEAKPESARPGTALFPGAEAAGASIRQQQLLAGLSYEQPLFRKFRNKTTAYVQHTGLRNPTIQNYGRNSEAHGGARTTISRQRKVGKAQLKVEGGTEWQEGFTTVHIYKNRGGQPDSLRSSDEIRNTALLLFLQATVEIGPWTLTAGSSRNWLRLRFERFNPGSGGLQQKRFRQWAPRVALLRRIGQLSAWASWSHGFSPPTTGELLPTGGAINTQLAAEQGDSYEAGLKGLLFPQCSFELSAYTFALRQTIVQRRTAGGGDYFVNAGRTRQRGMETAFHYSLAGRGLFSAPGLLWLSHSYQGYRYAEFQQLAENFSGNALPGSPKHSVSAGAELWLHGHFFFTVSYFYNSRMPLNDANTAFAESFHLVGARAGFQQMVGRNWRMRLVLGAENLLNERYSLGNDINGFGGRYYNAAPGRNGYLSILVEHLFRK